MSDPTGAAQVSGTPESACSAEGFRGELEQLINRHSRENRSNTPDFLLAEFITNCLIAYENATMQRDRWYGIAPRPGVSPNPAQHRSCGPADGPCERGGDTGTNVR